LGLQLTRENSGDLPIFDDARLAQAYRRMLTVLSDRTSLAGVAKTAASLACELLDADGATVSQVMGNAVKYIAAVGSASAIAERTLPIADSFTGVVIESKEPMVFDPRAAPASSVARAREDVIRSGIVCPIILEGRVVGTIGVLSQNPHRFDDVAVVRLSEFARFLSIGLDRNLDHQRLERADHFYRLGQLANHVVENVDAPLGSLLASLGSAREVTRTLETAARTDLDCWLMQAFQDLEAIHRLVADLRMFATDDSARLPVDIDALAILEKVCDSLRTRIERVALFDLIVPPTLPHVRAVPGRLWQICYALLVNAVEAIEANPRGHHSIVVEASEEDATLNINVRDTGKGIEPADLELIFEPFFSTKHNRDRGGLGLTMVWRYLDALGGTIRVESELGAGSTFFVCIPSIAPTAHL